MEPYQHLCEEKTLLWRAEKFWEAGGGKEELELPTSFLFHLNNIF